MNTPIRQIAYFVADIRIAAMQHHRLFGSGPFYVADHIPTPLVHYRGRPAALDHSSAYGQWGSLMVEFVQQHDSGPSAFHDMYPAGSNRQGLHHVALFVDDLEREIARYEREGFPVALDAEMASGFRFVMIDTVASYGHMIELYRPQSALIEFYEMVAQSARERGIGEDVLRPLPA